MRDIKFQILGSISLNQGQTFYPLSLASSDERPDTMFAFDRVGRDLRR